MRAKTAMTMPLMICPGWIGAAFIAKNTGFHLKPIMIG